MKHYLLLIPALLLASSGCNAQQWQNYHVYAGTGFFVNRQDIITNAHVVEGCKDVIIKGGVPEHKAIVKFTDKEHDLAVIETDMPPP